jgi:hypothetical protein
MMLCAWRAVQKRCHGRNQHPDGHGRHGLRGRESDPDERTAYRPGREADAACA